MTDKNESKKGFSTCLENAQFAEMMQTAMGKQGIGSLCAAMMKEAGPKAGDCMTRCTEMMQTVMKGCCAKQETMETNKEGNHVDNK